ncbi:unnamed protein product [Prunus armeniaca]|uniref:TF-B3 domain-containing protein n=1 Tax=Prunus armeniaca TaxID=36596 RepID=A0A6J5U0W6_PRUAR|nr:unnamed protein product [Prunus armeniaca]
MLRSSVAVPAAVHPSSHRTGRKIEGKRAGVINRNPQSAHQSVDEGKPQMGDLLTSNPCNTTFLFNPYGSHISGQELGDDISWIIQPQRLDNWKAFAIDNNLKVGDSCVFEQLECSSTRLVFRVQILRGDIPFEFLDKLDGDNVDAPIVLE